MNTAAKRRRKPGETLDDLFVDDLNGEFNERIDPETLAKQVTDPIIESMRREMEKIDVTRFKR